MYILIFRVRKLIWYWNYFLFINFCNLFIFSLFNIYFFKIRYFDEYRFVYIYFSIFFLIDYENDKLYMLLYKYIIIYYYNVDIIISILIKFFSENYKE